MSRIASTEGHWKVKPGDWDWLSDAACGDLPTELFFGHKGFVPPEVRKTCERCPVRKECFLFAVKYGERGIWAGLKGCVRNYLFSALRRELQAELPDGARVTKQDVLDHIASMPDDQFRSFIVRPSAPRGRPKKASR